MGHNDSNARGCMSRGNDERMHDALTLTYAGMQRESVKRNTKPGAQAHLCRTAKLSRCCFWNQPRSTECVLIMDLGSLQLTMVRLVCVCVFVCVCVCVCVCVWSAWSTGRTISKLTDWVVFATKKKSATRIARRYSYGYTRQFAMPTADRFGTLSYGAWQCDLLVLAHARLIITSETVSGSLTLIWHCTGTESC